jgi:sec-independent protein translocase protein TatA
MTGDKDMHAPGPMQLLLIAIVLLVLFGRGKISSMMGEVGKGITAFKKGVKEGSEEIEQAAADTAKDVTPEKDKV